MKRFFLTTFTALITTIVFFAQQTNIERDLSIFDNGNNMLECANQLLENYYQAGLTDEPIKYTINTPVDTLKLQVWYWTGEYYYEQAEFSKALKYGEKALPLAKDDDMKADCLNLLSLACFRQADYEKAASYAKQCYKLDEKSGDPDLMSSSLNTIAGIYLGANQPQQAEEYILKAIDLAKRANNPARQAVLHGTASEIYHAMLKDDLALQHINTACDLEKKLGRDDKLMVRLTQKASVLNGLHRYDEAEQVLKQAIPALRQMGDLHSLGIALNKMGMAIFSQNRETEAIPYFREAADIFVKTGDLGNELHARRGLYESLWKSNPDSAKIELDRFDLLKDSLYSHASAESLARINAELDNDWLQKENETQRARMQYIIIGATVLAALLAVGVWWWMRRRSRVREAALQAIIDELRENTNSKSDTELPSADHEFLSRIVDFVRKEMPNGNMSVEALADNMCLTRGHLNRRMKAITGITTQQYIARIRLEHARLLLEHNPGLSVTDVATQCGFEDASSFSRAFRRAFGITPTQHRQGS